MRLPPIITFRRLRGTDALEADIRRRLDKLETYCPRIMAARVLMEPTGRHHRDGNRYHVRIDLTVPGEEIVIRREAGARPTARALSVPKTRKQDEPDRTHRYASVAIREAFDAARRRLQDVVRRQRGTVKLHTALPNGRVVRLFPAKAYGFLEASDGHEVYFQKTSVLGRAFDRLDVGSRVAFVEERGEKGPQASTVRLVR
jgi:cold shock CspA family protein/ribosome-associated translation inhibitor RaiA